MYRNITRLLPQAELLHGGPKKMTQLVFVRTSSNLLQIW